MNKTVLTTFQAAEFCKITPNTLKNWIKSNGLQAHRTAGGHYRILKDDLLIFMKRNNIPVPEKGLIIRKRILIVDDDSMVRETMAKFIRKNYSYLEVATAGDGFEAGIQVSQFNPDIIILDLMMPQMDGFSVCRRIKENPLTSAIRIIILTGFGIDKNVRKAYECGADLVLKKPLKSERLLEEINVFMRK